MSVPGHRLSILVVAFNEGRHIANLARAVRALPRPAGMDLELVLVDGGSRDNTVAEARAAGFDKVIELPGANIPVCRNAALRAATGDWIAFLDGDCEPTGSWMEDAAALLAAQSLLLAGWPARPPEPMTWVQAAWNFHWLQKNPATEVRHGRRVVAREGFRLATTRNMVLHRSVAERIHGFNEELATGEDTDFAFRAHLAGVTTWGVPSLTVAHHGEPATLGAWFKQQLWHANRKSYKHILRLSGGKVGGNAPRFTAAYLATLVLALAAVIASPVIGHRSPVTLLLLLPHLAVIGGPAALLSLRGRTLRHFPALLVLYSAYGLARSIDLVGLHRAKPSWKAR